VRPVSSDRPDATRRSVVRGIGGLSCAAALTACGAGRETTPPPAPTSAPVAPAPPSTTAPALAATSDIPVGGGKVFPDFRLVVTRPSATDLKAFTAICTHDGCLLDSVADKTINCPCHGSRFAITDGAVVRGPAMRALTARTITVEGDSILLSS
jgi:nitrite reductase/ring-hydroxylating ferredoxin subunit